MPALQRGERRAQLVGRIGGEAAHLPERLVEPREHAVERLGEPVELVVVPCGPMRWCRSSAVMRRAAAVISSTGAERLPRDDGAARGREADPERDQDEQRLEIAAQHALGAVERAADLDDPDDAAALDDRHRQDPHCSRRASIVSKV